jgi:hypothetical protein
MPVKIVAKKKKKANDMTPFKKITQGKNKGMALDPYGNLLSQMPPQGYQNKYKNRAGGSGMDIAKSPPTPRKRYHSAGGNVASYYNKGGRVSGCGPAINNKK